MAPACVACLLGHDDFVWSGLDAWTATRCFDFVSVRTCAAAQKRCVLTRAWLET